MNEFDALFATPPVMRNSLILIGLTLRTFSTAVSCNGRACPVITTDAVPTRSPLNAAGPDVTLNIALALAPGATESGIVADVLVVPTTTDVHPFGAVMLNSTEVTGRPVVFVNVTVLSCDEPGENV